MKSRLGRGIRALLVAIIFAHAAPPHVLAHDAPEALCYGTAEDGSPRVTLWFYWSATCPHCQHAKPFVARMKDEMPWLDVRSLDIARPVAIEMYALSSKALGVEATSVPAFLFCGQSMVGYGSDLTTGADLRERLVACHDRLKHHTPLDAPVTPSGTTLRLPVLGTVDATAVSLPLVTVMIAGVDAFNPCAFFVLLFLLSLLAHASGRARMALVGGIFVVTSGVVYFASMAAWLNFFLLAGEMRWVTAVAATVAIVFAALNLKDFLGIARGGSLSLSNEARSALFARMRRLMQTARLPAMLAGTAALALVANAYELLCTSGLPMVFTRLLTLNDLSLSGYYLYLGLYNLIYVVPLTVIVGVFVATLGARKLQAHEGRSLKLMSGLMMLGLGVTLLVEPAGLSDFRVAAGIVVGASAVAALAWVRERRSEKRLFDAPKK